MPNPIRPKGNQPQKIRPVILAAIRNLNQARGASGIDFQSNTSADTTPPTVTITSTESSPSFAATIPITITFSEAVTGFVVGDITIAGCTPGSLSTSDNITFTVSVTATAANITVDIAQGVCTDAAGNGNQAATQFSIISAYYGLAGGYNFMDISKLYTDSARTTAVTVDSDVIGGITDIGGSANHGTQAGASSIKPLYKTNIQNGKSAALFDGVDDFINLPSGLLTGISAGTCYIIAKNSIDPGSAPKAGPPLGNTSRANEDEHFPYNDGIIYYRFASSTRQTVGNPTPSLTNSYAFDAMSKSGEWTARLNGSQLYTTATNTVTIGTFGNARLGIAAGGSYFWGGYIFTILVYNIEHSLAVRQSIEGYYNTLLSLGF